jgi:alkanesulfonate monooxygenase SsuD/methylene tetrahydromethanopterin reductase-like flavin-dependent oxidoreductase (luciferase family)
VWPDNERPFEETLAVVRACEGYGWHAAYYADHFMPNGPDETPLRGDALELLTTLGALAGATTSIRLGSLVASATYRHPAVLAKSFTTLDHLSAGRMIVGLGAGWQLNEHASYGIALGDVGERVSRFEEYVQVVASMLREERTNFEGRFFRLSDAPNDPRPVQTPPPVLLGVRGTRRTTRLAARFAEVWNAWTTPADLATLNGVLDAHCEELGRDPRTLVRSTQALVRLSRDEAWLARQRERVGGPPTLVGTPEEVTETLGRYREAGCDEFIVPALWSQDLSRALDTLALFDAEVAVHLR